MSSNRPTQYAVMGVLAVVFLAGTLGAPANSSGDIASLTTPPPPDDYAYIDWKSLLSGERLEAGPGIGHGRTALTTGYEGPPVPPGDVDMQRGSATTWLPVIEDAPIYEGQPDSSLSGEQGMWVGFYSYPDWLRERGLVLWDTLWLPESATVDYAATYLWLLDYTGASACDIATHRVTSWWNPFLVTWNSREPGWAWSTPGGDFASTPLAVVTVPDSPQWVWMGAVTSVVNGWHSNTYPDYGLLYRGTVESGGDSDRLFANLGLSGWQDPALQVDYTFNGSVEQLPANAPQTRSTPVSDHYFSHASLADWGWRAYGIRPSAGADYDLYLYDYSDFHLEWPPSVTGRRSWWGGDSVDLVVIGRAAPEAVRYARVAQWSGSGDYQVEFAAAVASLSGSGTFGPYSLGSDSVVRVLEFSGDPGQSYRFTLEGSGDADLGMMLCDPPVSYAGRGECSAYADDAGAGGTEQLEYQIGDTSDQHGLIVWNNGASGSGQFAIEVEPVTSLSFVYLPGVVRGYPTNPYEDDDRPSDAFGPLANGVWYYAYANDQDDYYYFTLASPAAVTVRVADFTATQGHLMVLDSGLGLVAHTTNQGHPSSMELTAQLGPGSYYVRVYAQGNLNTHTLYGLQVAWSP